jgi:histidinol dehydrogenase
MKTYDVRRTGIAELGVLLRKTSVDTAAVVKKARKIVDAVRSRGDPALREMAVRYDGFKGGDLRVPKRALLEASERLPPEVVEALRLSKSRIEEYHSRQGMSPFEYKDGCGVYGQKVVPFERIGVYAPGGTAAYGSSVLMACIPARIAGVREIALCSPPTGGRASDLVLAAANMCGVDEVYAVGGAQSIAAMAYGTETIPKVQKIVGPGGVFVSAAKLLVREVCEIDFLAGPSEILIIADSDASPEFLAADMVAQLEHDRYARAILMSDSLGVIESARKELSRMVSRAGRREIVASSYADGAAFVLVRDLTDAMSLSNAIAPEHLLLDVAKPRALLAKVRNAGSVFLGKWSSVAFGDYCAGTNHILPTNGVAAMKSALSVYDFQKIIPYQSLSRKGASELAGVVGSLAISEGLPCHALAALMRAEKVSR